MSLYDVNDTDKHNFLKFDKIDLKFYKSNKCSSLIFYITNYFIKTTNTANFDDICWNFDGSKKDPKRYFYVNCNANWQIYKLNLWWKLKKGTNTLA